MSRLYLYDDAAARSFEPFALTRPLAELRAGSELIRRRWERRLQATAAGFVGAPHLASLEELDAPPAVGSGSELEAGSIIVSSRCVVSLAEKDGGASSGARAWLCDGRVAAVRLESPLRVADLADGRLALDEVAREQHAGGPGSDPAQPSVPLTPVAGAGLAEIPGRWIEAPWDLIASLPEQLAEDIPVLAAALTIYNPPEIRIVGEHPVFCERGAVVEPWVVLDATAGPILIRTGAVVSSFTRISGPCYIGPHSMIVGDRVASCSIGEVSKVRGEITNSIVLGHSNKGHTGFVGHSYLGRWVNLGAGTTTSNLKNTYGEVQVQTSAGVRATGQQFLGTFFGDHVKTGIGMMLTTGTILGAGANVFGTQQPPKLVPPFAWGDGEPYAHFELEKFLAVAERMMLRRHVELNDGARRWLTAAYRAATPR